MAPGDEWTRCNERLFSGWSDARVRVMEAQHQPAVTIFLDVFDRAFPRWDGTGTGTGTSFRVLDAGCGSGHLLLALHRHLHPDDLTRVVMVGVDVSPAMIERGREAIEAMTPAGDVTPSINLVLGDLVERLGTLGSFDIVTSVESIYYVRDIEQAFRAIQGVLNEPGIFLLLVEEDMVATGDVSKDSERISALKAEIDVDHFHFLTLGAYLDMFMSSGFGAPVVERRDGFVSILARRAGGSRI